MRFFFSLFVRSNSVVLDCKNEILCTNICLKYEFNKINTEQNVISIYEMHFKLNIPGPIRLTWSSLSLYWCLIQSIQSSLFERQTDTATERDHFQSMNVSRTMHHIQYDNWQCTLNNIYISSIASVYFRQIMNNKQNKYLNWIYGK